MKTLDSEFQVTVGIRISSIFGYRFQMVLDTILDFSIQKKDIIIKFLNNFKKPYHFAFHLLFTKLILDLDPPLKYQIIFT